MAKIGVRIDRNLAGDTLNHSPILKTHTGGECASKGFLDFRDYIECISSINSPTYTPNVSFYFGGFSFIPEKTHTRSEVAGNYLISDGITFTQLKKTFFL